MSQIERLARGRRGPIPIIRGGTPAVAAPTTRARGFRPYSFTAASEATMSAAAPSLTPDALPAVTELDGPNSAGNLASVSSVVSGRGCSSILTETVSRRPAS